MKKEWMTNVLVVILIQLGFSVGLSTFLAKSSNISFLTISSHIHIEQIITIAHVTREVFLRVADKNIVFPDSFC